MKYKIMGWAGHVARMGEGRGAFWWENLRERDHWGDPGVDERIFIKRIFKKWNGLD
jgi:hypothetical protein